MNRFECESVEQNETIAVEATCSIIIINLPSTAPLAHSWAMIASEEAIPLTFINIWLEKLRCRGMTGDKQISSGSYSVATDSVSPDGNKLVLAERPGSEPR